MVLAGDRRGLVIAAETWHTAGFAPKVAQRDRVLALRPDFMAVVANSDFWAEMSLVRVHGVGQGDIRPERDDCAAAPVEPPPPATAGPT